MSKFYVICVFLCFNVKLIRTRIATNSILEKYESSLLNQLSNGKLSINQQQTPSNDLLSLASVQQESKKIEHTSKANDLHKTIDQIYQRPIIPTDETGQPLQAYSKAQRALKSKSMQYAMPSYSREMNKLDQAPFGLMRDHAFLVNDFYGFGTFSKDLVIVRLN